MKPKPARSRAKATATARPAAAEVDAYLANLSAPMRAALERLRGIIRKAEPELEECINYGVPSYRIDGRHTVAFGAAAKHLAFYPGAVVEEFAAALQDYSTSKGTIRFRPDQKLPAALIRAIVRAQVARRRRM